LSQLHYNKEIRIDKRKSCAVLQSDGVAKMNFPHTCLARAYSKRAKDIVPPVNEKKKVTILQKKRTIDIFRTRHRGTSSAAAVSVCSSNNLAKKVTTIKYFKDFLNSRRCCCYMLYVFMKSFFVLSIQIHIEHISTSSSPIHRHDFPISVVYCVRDPFVKFRFHV
jgi:hypothetical protein